MNDANHNIADAFEALLLDFLQYRKEKKMSAAVIDTTTADDFSIIPTIGKGWPHYRTLALPFLHEEVPDSSAVPGYRSASPHSPALTHTVSRQSASQTTVMPESEALQPILDRLKPLVVSVIQQYGIADCAQGQQRLVDHVIAKATCIPEISEIIKTSEATSWGRLSLLRAVIILMLQAQIHLVSTKPTEAYL